jgi:uncharacterized membrane-anchored protein
MSRYQLLAALLVAAAFAAPTVSQDPEPEPQLSLEEAMAQAGLEPQKGKVPVGDQATVSLGEGWIWLRDEKARGFLESLGNPPRPAVLGVALAPDYMESGVFAVYSYADEGHIEDDEEPDYDALLASMQESTTEESRQRKEAGLPTVQLNGWAEPPHYDRQQHKMYWAERLLFEEHEEETLNYNVRILGRSGYMVVQGVGDMAQLQMVADHCKSLLAATEFLPGKRYENFDPSYDKVAAYGIGGLIAGKMALKVGLFAKLGLLLKAFIKPILVVLALAGASIVRLLKGKKAAAAPAAARTSRRSRSAPSDEA